MEIKRSAHFSVIKKLGVISLLSSFAAAIVSTIWAIYIYSFVQNDSYVGFITSFFTIIGVLAFIFMTPVVQKCNKAKLYGIVILTYIVSYTMFALLPSLYVLIIIGSLLAVATSLRTTLFGIIIRDKTKDREVSKNEGLIYTLINISWFVGPVLAGFLSSEYGIKSVFLMAAFLFLITSILFRIFKIYDAKKTKPDKNPIKTFFSFFKNKKRIHSYIISGGVNLWWALIYIYIPLYIIESGFSEKTIGYFLGAIVVPLILTEYYFGKLAGKKGFRKIFTAGYFLVGCAAFACFFLPKIIFILPILVLASFGMGMLEPTTEAYFFDVITPKQRSKFYGPYNTTIEVNWFIGSSIPAVMLLFFPFHYIFLFFGTAMLVLSLISLKIKNIIENRR